MVNPQQKNSQVCQSMLRQKIGSMLEYNSTRNKTKKENNENIHLLNASGSKIGQAGQMPKVRNGVNTKKWIT